MRDAHAQNVINDELLLPVLRTFVRCARSPHATRNARCFQSVCGNVSLSPLPIAVQ